MLKSLIRESLKSGNPVPWTLKSVKGSMKKLHHDRLSVLKIDAEGAEW